MDNKQSKPVSYTITEACRLVGISRQSMMARIQDGKIEARKTAGDRGYWLIPAIAVENFRLARIERLNAELEKIQKDPVVV